MVKPGHIAGNDICVEEGYSVLTSVKIRKTSTCSCKLLVRSEGQKEAGRSSRRVNRRMNMVVASKDENFFSTCHKGHTGCVTRESRALIKNKIMYRIYYVNGKADR